MIRYFTLLALAVSSVQAAQIYNLNEHQEIEATISKTELNRIIVEKDRISDVFAYGNTLEVLPDERLGQIFVKAVVPSKETIRVTVTTEEGRIQDMRLSSRAIQGQTITLSERSGRDKQGYETSESEVLVGILSEFLKGQVPAGFRLGESSKEQKFYTSDRYTVEKFVQFNPYGQPIQLEEEMFVSIPQTRAIYICCSILEAGQSTEVWRISAND